MNQTPLFYKGLITMETLMAAFDWRRLSVITTHSYKSVNVNAILNNPHILFAH